MAVGATEGDRVRFGTQPLIAGKPDTRWASRALLGS